MFPTIDIWVFDARGIEFNFGIKYQGGLSLERLVEHIKGKLGEGAKTTVVSKSESHLNPTIYIDDSSLKQAEQLEPLPVVEVTKFYVVKGSPGVQRRALFPDEVILKRLGTFQRSPFDFLAEWEENLLESCGMKDFEEFRDYTVIHQREWKENGFYTEIYVQFTSEEVIFGTLC